MTKKDSTAKSISHDKSLEQFLRRYQKSRRPITVNFRELVPEIQYNTERSSHQIHPYPAKLLLHIPYFFLNTELFSSGSKVLDPFCGSGTVPLEVALQGGQPLGADSNPLARLITKVKLTPLDEESINKWRKHIHNRWEFLPECEPDVVNIRHWFYPHVIRQLAKLRSAVAEIENSDVRDFFTVCLSATVNQVSLADPRVAVPVRLNPERYSNDHWLKEKSNSRLNKLKRVNVLKRFESIVISNASRIKSVKDLDFIAPKILLDARNLKAEAKPRVSKNSMDLIITSPPYLGAQKYVRASSLSLGWLDLCPSDNLRDLEDKNIGREHYPKSTYEKYVATGIRDADTFLQTVHQINPLRAHIAAIYFHEMREAFHESFRALKTDARFVLVTSNNTVCGKTFPTKKYLRYILENELGMVCELEMIDHIKSRGLMTKRNKTAATIASESIYIFKKCI